MWLILSNRMCVMATEIIPIERILFGNEHWRSSPAIKEIEVYCDLLEDLQGKIDSLEIRGKDEELALINVQALLSSYALEIALKSLCALDNPTKSVPRTHDLTKIFSKSKEETVESLARLQFTRETLAPETLDDGSTLDGSEPFFANRYSMEKGIRDITVYKTKFLISVVQLLKDKLEETNLSWKK